MSDTPKRPATPGTPPPRRPAPQGKPGANGNRSVPQAPRAKAPAGGKRGVPSGKSPAQNKNSLSIDSLLNEINAEEKKTIEAFPSAASVEPLKNNPALPKEKAPEKLPDQPKAVPEEIRKPSIVFESEESTAAQEADEKPTTYTQEELAKFCDDLTAAAQEDTVQLDDDLDEPEAVPDEPEPALEDDLEDLPAPVESVKTPEEPKKRQEPEQEESVPAAGKLSLWGEDDSSGSSADKKKNRLMLIVIAVLSVIVIILLLQQCSCPGRGNGSTDDFFDQSAVEGTLPGKTPEEIQSMLNQIVEEGMFNVSIAPVILFETADGEGQARIENVPANHYHMSVAITLDETAETIYESKGIKPGQYIEYIRLQKTLAPGEYAATAVFTAYDADTLEARGRVAIKVTIYIEG